MRDRLAGCRRRLRLQGHPAAGGSLSVLAGACSCGHPVRWLEDRREQLTAERQLPRASLRHHRLCRSRRHAARHRLRSDRRFRRLFVLSVLGVPGGGAGRLEHPAGPYKIAGLSLPHLVGRHQQAADPALSRRGPHRRVLRAGTDARCGRARERGIEPYERAPAQPGPAGADAVRPTSPSKHFDSGDYPEALRRAVSADRPRWRARAPAQGRGGWAADRRRLRRCSASRARTAPRSITAGAFRWCRATSRRTARLTPDGGLELRVGVHSHGQGLETTLAQVAHSRCWASMPQDARRARRHGDDALFDRHLGLALHR